MNNVKLLGWYRPSMFYAVEIDGKHYAVSKLSVNKVNKTLYAEEVKKKNVMIIPATSEEKREWERLYKASGYISIQE